MVWINESPVTVWIVVSTLLRTNTLRFTMCAYFAYVAITGYVKLYKSVIN